MHLSHVIALDPTKDQRRSFLKAAGCARFTYNWALAEWNRQRASGGKPNTNDLRKKFNEIKGSEFPWMYESPKDANQQAFAFLNKAFSNFFSSCSGKRKGPKVNYPTFKKKGSNDSFYVSNDHFRIEGETATLPKVGKVRMSEPLRLKGKIMSGTVKRVADQWFLVVNVDCGDIRKQPNVKRLPVIGVDLGIKAAATLSTGEILEGPKPLKKRLKQLRHANRIMSRRKKGGSNRDKARKRLARLHAKIANIRKDFWHKTTTRLCRENQAIVIEDLSMAFMLKNRKLSRAASDVGLGSLRPLLEYKTKMFGCDLVVADRFFPSSKTCSKCSYVKDNLSLSERVWTCTNCGTSHDRDINAAINLQQYRRLCGNVESKDSKTPTETLTSEVTSVTLSRVAEVGTRLKPRKQTT